MFESFNSIVAHVAEVEVASDGSLKVHKIASAIDCGMAVNPDGVKAQIEGGIVFGLTAALHGEITIDKGAVMQANFPDYEMVPSGRVPGDRSPYRGKRRGFGRRGRAGRSASCAGHHQRDLRRHRHSHPANCRYRSSF